MCGFVISVKFWRKKENYVIPSFNLGVYSLNPRHGLSCIRLGLCLGFFPLAYFILDSLETWAFKFAAVGHMHIAFLQLLKFGLDTLKVFLVLLSIWTVHGGMVPALMTMITHSHIFFSPWSIVFDWHFFALRRFSLSVCLSGITPSFSYSGRLEPRAYACEVSSMHWAKVLALFRNFSWKPDIAISPLLAANIFILRYIFLSAWDEVND